MAERLAEFKLRATSAVAGLGLLAGTVQGDPSNPLTPVDPDFSRRILVGCFVEGQVPRISFSDRLTALVDGVKLPFDGGVVLVVVNEETRESMPTTALSTPSGAVGDILIQGSAATITDDARERGIVYSSSEITERSRIGVFVRNFIGTQTWQNLARACFCS